MTAGKTVPELTSETPPIVGTDELVVYRSPGPLKRATTATMRTYMAATSQPLDADLTAIAALTSAADKMPYATGAGTWAMADLTSFARTLLATANNSAFLTALGQIAGTFVNFLQFGTGAVTRDNQTKLRELASPEDFGAVGDGIADDTTALQNLLTAHKSSRWKAGANYKVTGTLVPQAGTVIDGNGATITQATAQTPIFSIGGVDTGQVFGLKLVGLRSDYVGSPSSLARAFHIASAGCRNWHIHNNEFVWFGYAALAATGVAATQPTGMWFENNLITGPGLIANGGTLNPPTTNANNGIVCGGEDLFILNNTIRDTGTGIIIVEGATRVVCDGNTIKNALVEHGIYADTGLQSVSISNNTVANTYADGIKCQFYDSAGLTPRNIVISGNSGRTIGSSFISILSTGGFTIKLEGLACVGNSCVDVAQDAYNVRYVNTGTFSGNTALRATRYGLYVIGCNAVQFTGNSICYTTQNGFLDGGSNTDCELSSNLFKHNGLVGGAVAAAIAVYIPSSSGWRVSSNLVVGDGTNTRYSFLSESTTNLDLSDNSFLNAQESGGRFIGTTFRRVKGNIATGVTAGAWQGFPTATTWGDAAHLEFFGQAIPSSGTYLVGSVLVNTAVSAASPVDRWVCTVAGTPGTWRPTSWVTGRGATGARPTLTASDIGVAYQDTTIDADGKVIWWNGTAWVDATGATV